MTAASPYDAQDAGLDALREHLLDGEMTIYDPRTQKAVILNPTATAVWECTDGTLGDVGIAALLAERFAQEPDSITPQVSDVLDEFDRLGLLEQRDPPRRRR